MDSEELRGITRYVNDLEAELEHLVEGIMMGNPTYDHESRIIEFTAGWMLGEYCPVLTRKVLDKVSHDEKKAYERGQD